MKIVISRCCCCQPADVKNLWQAKGGCNRCYTWVVQQDRAIAGTMKDEVGITTDDDDRHIAVKKGVRSNQPCFAHAACNANIRLIIAKAHR
ncbi:hypothetical protein BC831DRAFT_461633 [Entophlyctis helioformis]|nr:hypothetical protein BC831DRAFT_461633 [Entophlyctis helioformis]